MQRYSILVEWPDKAPNFLTETRRTPKSRRGAERQHENVVKKYIEYFSGFDYQRLTITRL